MATKNADDYNSYRTAASTAVMRSGRHFVQFTVVEGDMSFGMIRPGWDVEGGTAAHRVDGHCAVAVHPEGSGTYAACKRGATYGGLRHPGFNDWEGMQPATEQGDRIGMLLDLDQGSMTVWKNDERLGVMVAEGLSGPSCWVVSLYRGDSARIESAPLPEQH